MQRQTILTMMARDRQMTDKLTVTIGNVATLQADGSFAIVAALIIAIFFGIVWFAARRETRTPRSQ